MINPSFEDEVRCAVVTLMINNEKLLRGKDRTNQGQQVCTRTALGSENTVTLGERLIKIKTFYQGNSARKGQSCIGSMSLGLHIFSYTFPVDLVIFLT